MAEIVLGIGSSHGPQLNIPPDKWSVFLEKDQNDPRYNYKEVLKRANPEIRAQLSDEVFKKKYNVALINDYPLDVPEFSDTDVSLSDPMYLWSIERVGGRVQYHPNPNRLFIKCLLKTISM